MINRKIAAIVVVAVAILGIVLSLWVSSEVNDSGNNVDLYVAPKDSSLLLDGKTTISAGKQKISAGKHSLKITRDGFLSETQSFTAKSGELTTVLVSLTPNSEEGFKYQKDNQDEFINIQNLGSIEYSKGADALSKNYPILSKLPQDISPLYTIFYGESKIYPNNPTKIAIYIGSSSPANKQAALSSIYDMGYDPSDYEIIFESLQE